MNNTAEERKEFENNDLLNEARTTKKDSKRKWQGETGKMFAAKVAQTSSLFYLHSLLLIGGRMLNRILIFYHNLFALNAKDKAKIYRNLSNQYLHKGLYQKAIESLKEWSLLDPNNPDVHYHLALALVAAGKGKQAIAVLNKILKLNPKDKEAIQLKSKIQIKRKEYKDAISSLESLIEINPDNPDALYLLGVTYSRSDNIEKAIEAMKKASELDPEESKYYQYLGLLYERSGKQKEAAACFSRVMDLEDQGDEEEDNELD